MTTTLRVPVQAFSALMAKWAQDYSTTDDTHPPEHPLSGGSVFITFDPQGEPNTFQLSSHHNLVERLLEDLRDFPEETK